MIKKLDRPYLWKLPVPPKRRSRIYGAVKVVSRICLGAAITVVGFIGGSSLYNNETSYVDRRGDTVQIVKNYWPRGKMTFRHLKEQGSTMKLDQSFSDDSVTFIDHDKDDSIDAMLVCRDDFCDIVGRGLPGSREYQIMEDATMTFGDIKEEKGIDKILKEEFGPGYSPVNLKPGEYIL